VIVQWQKATVIVQWQKATVIVQWQKATVIVQWQQKIKALTLSSTLLLQTSRNVAHHFHPTGKTPSAEKYTLS